MSRPARMRAGEGQRQLAAEIRQQVADSKRYHVARLGDKVIVHDGADTAFWAAFRALEAFSKRNDPGVGSLTQEQYDLVKDCV